MTFNVQSGSLDGKSVHFDPLGASGFACVKNRPTVHGRSFSERVQRCCIGFAAVDSAPGALFQDAFRGGLPSDLRALVISLHSLSAHFRRFSARPVRPPRSIRREAPPSPATVSSSGSTGVLNLLSGNCKFPSVNDLHAAGVEIALHFDTMDRREQALVFELMEDGMRAGQNTLEHYIAAGVLLGLFQCAFQSPVLWQEIDAKLGRISRRYLDAIRGWDGLGG